MNNNNTNNKNIIISTRLMGKYMIVEVAGNITSENEYLFRKNLNLIIDEGNLNIVINMTNVSTITEYALGVFVNIWKKITSINGSLDLVINNPFIIEKVYSLNLHVIIRISQSFEEFEREAFAKNKEEIETITRQVGKYFVLDIQEPLNIFCGYKELDNLLSSFVLKGKKNLAIDMRKVVHLYSEVIGTIIKWQKLITELGGSFRLVNLNDDIKARLIYLGLNAVLENLSTEKDLEDI